MTEYSNTILFKRSSYRTIEEMFIEIDKQINLLLTHKYAVSIYQSLADENIWCVEFATMDLTLSDSFALPMYVTAEEARVITEARTLDKDSTNKNNTDGGNFDA